MAGKPHGGKGRHLVSAIPKNDESGGARGPAAQVESAPPTKVATSPKGERSSWAQIQPRFIAAVIKDGEGGRWRECRGLPHEVFPDATCRNAWRAIRAAESYEAAAKAGRKFFAHETDGFNYLDDRKALFLAALKDLEDVPEWAATLPANFSASRFPAFETEPPEREILEDVEPIIAGLLEPGDKMNISSGSKSFKTWTLIQLAYAVNTGTEFLGFRTNKRKVLFLNFEIKPRNFWRRVFRVRRALGLKKADDFTVWNLRGKGFSMDDHAEELIRRAKQFGAGLIVLDPIYKLFGDRNESSAGDMGKLMLIFDRITDATGAAIAYAHHFAKGNQAAKDAMERQSGSTVFARDPDCLISMTRLDENEGQNTFAVDVTLRDFQPVDKFGLRREHPIMVRDDSVNTQNLHQPGRQSKYDLAKIVATLPAPPLGLRAGEWQTAAGMGTRSTFNEYRAEAERLGLVFKDKEDDLWKRKG